MEECQGIFYLFRQKSSNIVVGVFCIHCGFYMSCIYQHFVCQFREDTLVDCGYRNCFFWEVGYDVGQETEKFIFIHSFSILSDDRSKASSKTIPPHSAI